MIVIDPVVRYLKIESQLVFGSKFSTFPERKIICILCGKAIVNHLSAMDGAFCPLKVFAVSN